MISKIAVALSIPQETTGRWAKIIATFIAGQGLVQLLQLLGGFFLIRWLSVEDYAQYSMAFAFQSTAQILVGLGFSSAIIALTGNNIHEKKLLGDYISAGKFYRNRLYAVVGGCCLVGFPLMTAEHDWPVYITILLLVAILSSLYFTGNNAFYKTPLLIHKRLRNLYSVQIKSGFCRIIFFGLFYSLSFINAWIAALVTSGITWYEGRAFKKKAKPFFIEPEISSVDSRKEMLQYVKPVMPGIIYSAFSTQIALFVISIFGSTQNIAEVGALGRLGQIFLIFNVASSTLIVPYLAKQSSKNLQKKYLFIISIAILFSCGMVATAFLVPESLLWIIGNKYAHLEKEVGLLVLNSSIIFINVVMWDMNCSRKWLWSWIPVVSISSNLVAQFFLIFKMDLDTTYNVLVYSVILSVFNLSNKILVAIIGFKKSSI